MNDVGELTHRLRHISELQGIERLALQWGDQESLYVARWMRDDITRIRAEMLAQSSGLSRPREGDEPSHPRQTEMPHPSAGSDLPLLTRTAHQAHD